MHVYLYDAFVRTGPYARVMKTIENRLTDLELSGKMIKLAAFSNPRSMLLDELRSGAKTAIVIGDENTFGRVLTKCADVEMVFGWIPVGRDVSTREQLDVPYGEESCRTIAARRVIELPVLKVNDRYAIALAHVPMTRVWISVDGKYALGPMGESMEVAICNLRSLPWCEEAHAQFMNQEDLYVHIRPLAAGKQSRWRPQYAPLTSLPFSRMTMYGKAPFELFLDGQRSKETRVTIERAAHSIRIIAGKNRVRVAS